MIKKFKDSDCVDQAMCILLWSFAALVFSCSLIMLFAVGQELMK